MEKDSRDIFVPDLDCYYCAEQCPSLGGGVFYNPIWGAVEAMRKTVGMERQRGESPIISIKAKYLIVYSYAQKGFILRPIEEKSNERV